MYEEMSSFSLNVFKPGEWMFDVMELNQKFKSIYSQLEEEQSIKHKKASYL